MFWHDTITLLLRAIRQTSRRTLYRRQQTSTLCSRCQDSGTLKCIAGYALSRVIHRIQSEIIFHGNPNLYMELLGTVDRQYPSYHLDLRTPPPPLPVFLLATPPPPPPSIGNVWEWWSDNLNVSLVYLAVWAEDCQAIPKSLNEL